MDPQVIDNLQQYKIISTSHIPPSKTHSYEVPPIAYLDVVYDKDGNVYKTSTEKLLNKIDNVIFNPWVHRKFYQYKIHKVKKEHIYSVTAIALANVSALVIQYNNKCLAGLCIGFVLMTALWFLNIIKKFSPPMVTPTLKRSIRTNYDQLFFKPTDENPYPDSVHRLRSVDLGMSTLFMPDQAKGLLLELDVLLDKEKRAHPDWFPDYPARFDFFSQDLCKNCNNAEDLVSNICAAQAQEKQYKVISSRYMEMYKNDPLIKNFIQEVKDIIDSKPNKEVSLQELGYHFQEKDYKFPGGLSSLFVCNDDISIYTCEKAGKYVSFVHLKTAEEKVAQEAYEKELMEKMAKKYAIPTTPPNGFPDWAKKVISNTETEAKTNVEASSEAVPSPAPLD